ncbi:hypothetical protein OIO90_000689 [Microbotryomycetes sp. JL221]|nr:hypothetical protein OIO90_000689 [Microbotryomycetes sp. JL221]
MSIDFELEFHQDIEPFPDLPASRHEKVRKQKSDADDDDDEDVGEEEAEDRDDEEFDEDDNDGSADAVEEELVRLSTEYEDTNGLARYLTIQGGWWRWMRPDMGIQLSRQRKSTLMQEWLRGYGRFWLPPKSQIESTSKHISTDDASDDEDVSDREEASLMPDEDATEPQEETNVAAGHVDWWAYVQDCTGNGHMLSRARVWRVAQRWHATARQMKLY